LSPPPEDGTHEAPRALTSPAARQLVNAVSWTPRYVRDLADLASCVRGERAFAYTHDHDLAVQETLLRACDTLR